MCKKLLYLVPVALVLALLVGNMASAELIAHWPLDGDYADATGNGHDGTPLDDPKFVIDAEKGLVLEVDGSARVMVDDASDLNFTANESLTMTAWILYDPGLASSGWRSPCGKGRTATGGDTSYLDTMYGFFVSPDNEWASNMGSLGGGVGPAVADEWHHFAFVQDGDSNENFYYINLEEVQSGGAADCSTPGRPFFIGASGSDTSPFEAFGGRISDVRIYNEALSGDALAATTVPLQGQIEILITFSDLDQAGEVPVAEDYQPSELDGTGITTTWTGMQQFNDDIAGEGLRDHTVTWDQAATSVYVYTENEGSIEFNTEVEVSSIWILQDSWASTSLTGYLGGQEIWSVPANHPEQWIEITEGTGHVIDSIVLAGGYSRIDDITIKISDTYSATDPSPADGADDVRRDVILSWESGKYAVTHNVYFGTSVSTVNSASVANPQDVLLIEGHDSNIYDPDVILDLGQTYFWRVDEVNAAPDYTVHRGKVWNFTAEPVGYPIADVTATASSFAQGQGPENTVNGSGLDADDQHSILATDMWLSDYFGPQPTWIQFEFDKAYTLHELWVWNSNQLIETSIGVGIMDVTIEYSQDGDVWTKLDDIRFNQAPGDPAYTANTTVDMKGVVAQFVKLTPKNNWMSILEQYSLSEVRFFYVPVLAIEPDPQDGATGIHPDIILSWRPGRKAATHDVYLSTDEQDVINGTAAAATVTETSYDAGTLELGETYHWRVDEVNAAEIPAIWKGDIWNFTTADYIVVDNFESYNGFDPDDPQSNRIFMMWKDGIGYGTQDNPPYSAGNGTGSIIGHDAPPFVERQIVHDGSQSMPYFYNNSGLSGKANYSEVAVDISALGIDSDWTKAGVKTLTLQFYGDPANSAGEQMYLKINGIEVLYDGASSDITHGVWQQWDIELSSVAGVDLQNVTELIIGFMNGGGSGVVYFDNIRLNPATEIPDSQAPNDSALVAHWDFEGDFTDATGKGHDGLAFGDPAIINDPLRGQVLEVDGDDRVGISDAVDLNFGADESLTLTTWVNLDLTDPLEGWRAIVAKGRTELGGSTDYVDTFYGFYVSPGTNWHVNAGDVWDDSQAAAGGQWHHLAFVQDGPANVGYFYIDGELIMTAGADSCDTTGRPLFIGAAGTDVDVAVFEAFKGRIDDVRIYSYALSELEIQYLVLD